ncbi:hypothetical protein [Paraflavitalea speifideaquila]|uniref:hypothetical protein n=1 Tax=Paraflavitalea speifideaquila TaxID=3076558 RepID=UPI0028F0E77E|nr:hypothetical protein [Paraflavitalea speifideiaquila]
MGVGAFLPFGEGTKLAHITVLESVEQGWWYCATLSPDRMTAVFFSDADIVSKQAYHTMAGWTGLLQQTRQVKQLLQGANANEELWVKNAHTQISHCIDSRSFLAIGDAALAFDPVSSFGIGFAITSACQAAAIVLLELSKPERQRILAYQRDLERHFNQYQVLRRKIYGHERRWPAAAFWQRRQEKMATV